MSNKKKLKKQNRKEMRNLRKVLKIQKNKE